MNREIKFRGKRVKEHEYQYMDSHDDPVWAYGSLLVDNDCYCIVNDHGGFRTVDEVHPETVGQFTDLRDKNGKCGYDSDILLTPVGNAIICFGEYSQPTGYQERHMGFYLKFEREEDVDVYRKDIGYWLPRSIIIGNIHQHPELLK